MKANEKSARRHIQSQDIISWLCKRLSNPWEGLRSIASKSSEYPTLKALSILTMRKLDASSSYKDLMGLDVANSVMSKAELDALASSLCDQLQVETKFLST